jgi:hypothetical protein
LTSTHLCCQLSLFFPSYSMPLLLHINLMINEI